jgi:hypothetical protein
MQPHLHVISKYIIFATETPLLNSVKTKFYFLGGGEGSSPPAIGPHPKWGGVRFGETLQLIRCAMQQVKVGRQNWAGSTFTHTSAWQVSQSDVSTNWAPASVSKRVLFLRFTVGYARTNVIGSRTSFVIAYIEIYVFRGNPFLAHSLKQSYHPIQRFKQKKYNTKWKI